MGTSKKSRRFILVDFNCSNEYTHQWSSITAYCSLLNRYDRQVEVWLPRGAAKNIIERISSIASVTSFLRSPQYYNASFLKDPSGILFGKLVRSLFRKNSWLGQNKKIHRIVVNFYLKDLMKEIYKIDLTEGATIIFPTLDYLGLETVRRIISESLEVKVYVRRMGLEERHPLAKGDEFQLLQELINRNENKNVVLGIPTKTLLYEVRAKSRFPNMIKWSPLPPDPRTRGLEIDNNAQKVIKIGFPGTAKSSKGYDSIPNLAAKIKKEKLKFKIIVQQANYEWDTYQFSRQKIKDLMGEDFLEYGSVLSVIEYENLFHQYDVIFLPYKFEEYVNADSGILYEAANWGIPVICPDGLGFSTEAFDFGIGLNPDSFETFLDLFEYLSSEELSTQISAYNKARDLAIADPLELL